jgi:uncharacterized protein YjiS (DUF1127 family)
MRWPRAEGIFTLRQVPGAGLIRRPPRWYLVRMAARGRIAERIIEMTIGLRLSRVLAATWPKVEPYRIDPIGALQRMDAAYRERRRLEGLTPETLEDVGMTRADLDRILGR